MAVQKSSKNKDTSKAPKANSGLSARRPILPKENIEDTQNMIRARRASLSKKDKSNLQELPDGVVESLKNKERIKEALTASGEGNSISELKSKYDCVGTPLTHKKAKVITAERNTFFAENRSRHKNNPEVLSGRQGLKIKKIKVDSKNKV